MGCIGQTGDCLLREVPIPCSSQSNTAPEFDDSLLTYWFIEIVVDRI